MDDQYDAIGGRYSAVKDGPLAIYTEIPTVCRLLGDLGGKTALDVACGTGYYTRLLSNLGAERVRGVDLSPAMIAAARREEVACPRGIKYYVADAADLPGLGTFDLVTAIFLFNYASDLKTLRRMCQNIAINLTHGGRLIAIAPNPDFVSGQDDTAPYLFKTKVLNSEADGSRMRLDFLMDPPFSIEYWQWSRAVYEEALSRCGFERISWIPFEVAPEGVARHGENFWRAFRRNPPNIALTAQRSRQDA